MLCCAVLCYAMLCYAMLCYATLRYAMLCYAMLCYAMLCYAFKEPGSPGIDVLSVVKKENSLIGVTPGSLFPQVRLEQGIGSEP